MKNYEVRKHRRLKRRSSYRLFSYDDITIDYKTFRIIYYDATPAKNVSTKMIIDLSDFLYGSTNII